MVYKRRVVRRTRARKTSRVNTTRVIARQEAKRVIARKLEVKQHDLYVEPLLGVDSVGAVLSLTTGMVQGIQRFEYIGDTITPTSLSCRIMLTSATGGEANFFRIIILQVKQGGIPVITTVLDNSLQPISSPISRLYQDTVSIKYDKVHRLCSGDVTNKFVTLKFRNLKQIHFTNTSGTVESGGIYVCLITDSGAVPHPMINMSSRIGYTDA